VAVTVRRVLAAILVAMSAAACATVPETSDVRVVRAAPAAGPQIPPPVGPTAGASPFRLARDFIEATGSPANGHAAARAFLTEDAAAAWDDDASLTLIEDSPDAALQPPEPGVSSVRVQASRIGTLDGDGSFTPDAGVLAVELRLVREDGEWRISNPPPGVLVESTAFQQNYRSVNAWFIDEAGRTLVPDVRWVPAQPESTLAGRALDLLIAGPSEALADAVVSAVPPGTRPRSNVLVGPDGRVTIDLAEMGAVGEQQRRLAAAQIVSTFDGLQIPSPYLLLADREPLVPGKPEWRTADITAYTSAGEPRPDVPGLVVYGGRLRGLNGVPLAGPAGSGELSVRTAARSSPTGEQLAVVAARPDGSPQLLVGPTGGEALTVVDLAATSMTRPTWRASDNEVWTVINGTTVAGVALSDSGRPTPYTVNASDLVEFGPITDLRLSRDGARVAAVAGGRLLVATVVTGPGEVSIQRPQLLRQGSLPPSASVDWARSDLLVVVSSDPSPQVSSVSVDGVVYRSMSTTNLNAPLTGVVAAPGREVVVSDVNGLWAYSETQEVWEPLLVGIGPAAVPLYPG